MTLQPQRKRSVRASCACCYLAISWLSLAFSKRLQCFLGVMDSTITPREATEGDFAAIVQLFRENEILCTLGQDQGNDDWLRIGRSYVERTCRGELSSWEACSERLAGAGSKLWVVEEGGEVAGCIGAVRLSPERLELVRMYVDGRCRRRGFGRALVQVLLDHALEVGASEVELTTPQVNEAAICFYQEMGFSFRAVIPVVEAGLPFNLVQLTRVIELSGL